MGKAINGVSASGAHEVVPAGTFDVVFESFDWRDARLLYARSATGTFPPPGALTRAMMSLLLGPGLPLASLREWQPLLLRALWGIHFHRWAERAGERVAAAGGSVGRWAGGRAGLSRRAGGRVGARVGGRGLGLGQEAEG